MITDKSTGRLDQIRSFAKKNNLMENFNQTFSRLESYSAKGYEVTLYSDFAPLSMEFSITDNGKLILYGGLYFTANMMVLEMVVLLLFLFVLILMINQVGEFTLKMTAMKQKRYYYFGFYRDYLHHSRPVVLQVTTCIDCLSCEILGGHYPLIWRQLTPKERNQLANELARQYHASYIEIGDGARRKVLTVSQISK